MENNFTPKMVSIARAYADSIEDVGLPFGYKTFSAFYEIHEGPAHLKSSVWLCAVTRRDVQLFSVR